MPTEVHTICFHTRDAVERDDSRMVFELPMHRLRTPAVKIALGSMEFPMVQWTIESDWSRIWMSEGIRVHGGSNELSMLVRGASERVDPPMPTVVGIPMRLNPIVSVKRTSNYVEFECKEPHYLWGSDGACLIPLFTKWGSEVRVVSCTAGDISLNIASQDNGIAKVSETVFAVQGEYLSKIVGSVAWNEQPSFLFTSAIPGPSHLCELLTLSARGAIFVHGATSSESQSDTSSKSSKSSATVSVGQEVVFKYDSLKDHVNVETRFEKGSVVRILPSPLSGLLGTTTSAIRLASDHETLPSGPTNMWDYVTIPTGFYAPCHRPMCTGQPMRFGTEVESSINRLYFPLPGSQDNRMQASPSTPHMIVFVDPWSKTNMCPIPCGRYSPDQLCLHLEAEMTRTCKGRASFSVSYDEEEERFVFACEKRRPDGRVVPAVFSILFNHPLSTESARFGFPAQPCIGAASYTSTEQVHIPRADLRTGEEKRFLSNLLRVSEIGPQKRFRIHATSTPTMTALMCKREDGRCTLRTHVNGLPYSHGYQLGDIVKIFPPAASVSLMEPNEDKTEWKEEEYPACAPFEYDLSAVVIATDSEDPSTLMLFMPFVADVGTCVQVMTTGPEPFNLCFSRSRPKSIDPYILGFPEKSIQWGIDGSLNTGVCKIPPFDAPNTHSLDHPDYVLITLNESSGASLEHHYDGESKHVFCKLSLYPLFREERMLPRDAMLQRSTFSRFELAFWNPDMRRPYKFHGAEFSFSLNFISALPGGE